MRGPHRATIELKIKHESARWWPIQAENPPGIAPGGLTSSPPLLAGTSAATRTVAMTLAV
ncbi:MAG: hypothetical protein E6G96_06310 [Alphaproteobacteria bacterium]|nr:MAG: hypothetical protein E6G96_06310 [Alphaproteobacteria bacterium]